MGEIAVVGVGFYEDQLTLGAVELLKSGRRVILHTARCALAQWLGKNGVAYAALDSLYETADDFDAHARAACEAVLEAAEEGDVTYCVFDVRDASAVLLARRGARIVPGPPTEGALYAHADGEMLLVAASAWEDMVPDASRATIVREVDSRELACEVKLRLMRAYPDDREAMVLTGGGVARIPLYDLDRLARYDHRTAVLVKAVADPAQKTAHTLRDLTSLVARDGQAYARRDYEELCKMALALAGGAKYASDRGEYDLADVITDVCLKLLNLRR